MMPRTTIQPDIQANCRYPGHFTQDLFAVSNPRVRDIVAPDGAGPPLKKKGKISRWGARIWPPTGVII